MCRVSFGRTGIIVGGLVASLLPACASTRVPSRNIPEPRDVGRDGRGAWVQLLRGDQHGDLTADGELLSVSADSVFLVERGLFRAVPRSEFEGIWSTRYRSNSQVVAAWALLGAFSTGSHGIALGATLPIWILLGIGTYSARVGEATTYTPVQKVTSLQKFARFPQGLPESFPRCAR